MALINLPYFNSKSPYTAQSGEPEGFYEFVTDHGVLYSVGFMEDDSLISSGAYQFIISNVNHQVSPSDDKVRQTIMLLVDCFFSKSNDTLLYLCETGDGKQAMRNRLFQYWFSQYDKKDDFTYLSTSITDVDGVVNYATIIIRNDNPLLVEIVNEFTQTVKLLREKPE